MTHNIVARNVNHALSEGLWYLSTVGVRETSRNGPVIVAPGPVVTEYQKPCERVLFNTARNANPFFHLMESLWMLAGRDDLDWPARFNSRFSEYSDNGTNINGAYGYRWRRWFGLDQLKDIIKLLRKDPETRRAVLGMWDTSGDLGSTSKDIPCNTHIYFDLRGGTLNMAVLCRSNDIIWGAYGANAVHMSVLHEFIATAIGVPVGVYRQYSHNYHLYPEHYDINDLALRRVEDLYKYRGVRPSALVSTSVESWLSDLHWFMHEPCGSRVYNDPFFTDTAAPMYAAWSERRFGRGNGVAAAEDIKAEDWRVACVEWLRRAEKRKQEREENAKS